MIALAIVCATIAVVLMILPREWLHYIMFGGAMVFLGLFMVLNILLLFAKDRKRRKRGKTSD